MLVALTEDVTNARSEGYNRIIKQTKRVACGFAEHGQLPKAHHGPHRRHPTATDRSMNSHRPAER